MVNDFCSPESPPYTEETAKGGGVLGLPVSLLPTRFLTSLISINWWGQRRNWNKAFLGLPLQLQGAKTSNRFLYLLLKKRWAGSLYGMRVGVCPGVGLEGWLGWFAHAFGGGVCKGYSLYPAFVPGSSEEAFGFFWSFYVLPIICSNWNYF